MNDKTSQKIIAFLPCRAGSQRVINKNIRPFAGIKGGLTKIKLEQLTYSKLIDRIIVSTDDDEVKQIACSFQDERIEIDNRPVHLATSDTKTDELIQYVPEIINEGVVLWTHVTSPFIMAEDYDNYIKAYLSNLNAGFDSLMTVTRIYKFLWNESGAINYDRSVEKWPRTQTLPSIYEVNSGAFIAPVDIYKTLQDRIGENPFLFETDELKSFDIDWEINFKTAEFFWMNRNQSMNAADI